MRWFCVLAINRGREIYCGCSFHKCCERLKPGTVWGESASADGARQLAMDRVKWHEERGWKELER